LLIVYQKTFYTILEDFTGSQYGQMKEVQEQLRLTEERAEVEHDLAEERKQEVNILRRALHLRDHDLISYGSTAGSQKSAKCSLEDTARVTAGSSSCHQ
jgi:ABC-type phosphate transport system auxiliary subunit